MLIERHERDNVALRRAQHGLVLGHPPLLSVDECGQFPDSDEMMKGQVGDVGMGPIRHGVLEFLNAVWVEEAAATLWT
jgi:hypothetical protein